MKFDKYDFLIIGCGITGCVIAREMANNGKKVLILDRRNHIGGNMYDYVDNHGILVQKYGPHIFHTNDERVYNYIIKYGEWLDYKLHCGAVIKNKCTPTPFNYQTIDDFYDKTNAIQLKQRIEKVFFGKKETSVLDLLNCSDPLIKEFADFLYEHDYKPYTSKQWGIDPKEIDVSVLKRVPIKFSYDNDYFNDKYQLMPLSSYTSFFNNILLHDNIKVALKVNALDLIHIKDGCFYDKNDKKIIAKVIYTGALDELFDNVFGNLPYRSLSFKWHFSRKNSIQDMAVVAYPEKDLFTRITEYNKLPYQKTCGTSYAVEFPVKYETDKKVEPYYPVLTDSSKYLYEKYQELADKISNLIYCGRLADFKYYNMDQSIKRALEISDRLLNSSI